MEANAYARLIMKTPTQRVGLLARREATARRNDQDGLNQTEETEYAYSRKTGAIGLRNAPGERFRVFNCFYPMYGRAELVTDWISVGIARAIGERGARRFYA